GNLGADHDVYLAISDRHSRLVQQRRQVNRRYLAELDAAVFQGSADVDARDRLVEVGLDHEARLKQRASGQNEQQREQNNHRHDNEQAQPHVVLLIVHDQVSTFRMIESGSRLKNWRTRGSVLCSRKSAGRPSAMMLRERGSSMTARSAMVKMLFNSWVTTTNVTPRLARSDRMVRCRFADVIGSRPAEGSSSIRMSAPNAMARAMPARLSIPPESSAGIRDSACAISTRRSSMRAVRFFSASPMSVNSSSGKRT